MISDRDFIVLADNWDGLPTSGIHLFRRIAKQNRVFWFNVVGRLPKPSLSDARKVFQIGRHWIRSGRKLRCETSRNGDTPIVQSPFMIPWFKPAVRKFNQRCFARQYDRVRREYSITNPIVVAILPCAVDFVTAIPDATRVYYCVDEFLDYPGLNHGDWETMEKELLQTVDALIVTSRDLERKQSGNCPTMHLPHGVDFDHFHQARMRSGNGSVLDTIRHPIVGFFGLISEWVDVDLIGRLSERLPDVSFVMIGKAEIELGSVVERPNVHHLGFVPYSDLPELARHFDIGIIPFVINRLTQAVNPLKLMEYFALGLPVVASRMSELESMEGPVTLASNEEEFVAAIRKTLAGDRVSWANAATQIARNNTWEARATSLTSFLRSLESSRSDRDGGIAL